MKITTQPPLHLSNHEVLTHFLALKKDTDRLKHERVNHALRQKAEMRAAYPLAKERDESPDISDLPELNEAVKQREDVADRRGWSDELAWIEDEVIKYLCSDHVPTARQTAEGVAGLADDLQDHHLTKGEVLQICNLAPTLPVELYAIIEDVDTRFHPNPNDLLEQIADRVRSTLLSEVPAEIEPYVTRTQMESSVRKGQPEFADTTGLGAEDEEALEEQQFITEAEYGKDYEGGVDDDAREEME